MLRRNINKLLDPTYAQELEARLEYMRTILVPNCYRWVVLCIRGGEKKVANDGGDRAFTSLIAGTHFAPMGLTLLAILARVHKIIRGQRKEKEEEKEVTEEKMMVEVPEEVKVKGTGLVVGPVTMEDFGETIRREVKEGKEEEEKMAVPENKKVGERKVAEKRVKKHKAVTQGSTKTSKMPLKKPNQVNQGGTSSGLIAKAEERKERAMKKVKAMEMASNSQSPPPPSPPVMKEPPKIKSKRKSGDGEEGKKKKKRKKDEIDDLFAGLL